MSQPRVKRCRRIARFRAAWSLESGQMRMADHLTLFLHSHSRLDSSRFFFETQLVVATPSATGLLPYHINGDFGIYAGLFLFVGAHHRGPWWAFGTACDFGNCSPEDGRVIRFRYQSSVSPVSVTLSSKVFTTHASSRRRPVRGFRIRLRRIESLTPCTAAEKDLDSLHPLGPSKASVPCLLRIKLSK